MQESFPIISVAVIGAVPHEVAFAAVVARKREEERRAIKSVLLTKLRKLFGCCLLTKNSHGRITGNKFDEYRNE